MFIRLPTVSPKASFICRQLQFLLIVKEMLSRGVPGKPLHFPVGGFGTHAHVMARKYRLTMEEIARMEEVARIGARAQLMKYGRKQLLAWGKLDRGSRRLSRKRKPPVRGWGWEEFSLRGCALCGLSPL